MLFKIDFLSMLCNDLIERTVGISDSSLTMNKNHDSDAICTKWGNLSEYMFVVICTLFYIFKCKNTLFKCKSFQKCCSILKLRSLISTSIDKSAHVDSSEKTSGIQAYSIVWMPKNIKPY